ncbi:Acyl-CoA dehydrogenase [Haloechinothrix alba]|uniref:Acyl-CoA dehydrogenase n=1 Tax=Haloechinothrix alba TaxID=664784 RepID=A0A239AFE2_9PSEU|nr:acyl-CoA dehydrogenase family protein [Haloechinothrix alba]SNR94325.1 Acyl-CoA dehydrogenase [Haloechinothrix alba]
MTTQSDVDTRAELRSAVRQCLDRHADVWRFVADGNDQRHRVDEHLYQRLAGEMGLAGLLVPEWLGGSGAGVGELSAACEELGSSLAPVPVFATAGLAVPALLVGSGFGADDVGAELLTSIADGAMVATLAVAESPGHAVGDVASIRATRSGDAWTVRGEKQFVVDGAVADVVLVPAMTDSGTALFAVDRTAVGVQVEPMSGIDLLRGLAKIRLDSAPARLIGADSGAEVALKTALELSVIVLAAEQVGGAQRCLDNAVAYAKQRVQFDRPIGSFQAVKHLLVDLLLEVELARSAMTHAVGIADEYLRDPSTTTAADLAEAAAVARSMCSETFMHVADEALHVHGGIGFTWEHDCHLYYRRAKFCELLFGNPYEYRERLATAAGLPG